MSLEMPSTAGHKGPESTRNPVGFQSWLKCRVVDLRPLNKPTDSDIGYFLPNVLMAGMAEVREGMLVPGSDGTKHARQQKGSHKTPLSTSVVPNLNHTAGQ